MKKYILKIKLTTENLIGKILCFIGLHDWVPCSYCGKHCNRPSCKYY